MPLVLASASPRRRDLLRMIGISDFRILPPTDELVIPGLPPAEMVCRIALEKASCVAPLCSPNDIILAADTLVFLDGLPLGKPVDQENAAHMLRLLSGRSHSVYSGLALLRNDSFSSDFDVTEVSFRSIPDSEIESYVLTGEPMDKAGAYAAQGRGAVFIERINGDFFNVVGLPLCKLSIMLREFGVSF